MKIHRTATMRSYRPKKWRPGEYETVYVCPMPLCGGDMSRLRHGFYECEKCKKRVTTNEQEKKIEMVFDPKMDGGTPS